MLSSSLVGLLSECEASLAYLGGKSPFSKALTAVAQCLVWCASPFLVSEHGRKGFLRFNKLLGNFSFQLNLSFLLFSKNSGWYVERSLPSAEIPSPSYLRLLDVVLGLLTLNWLRQ